MKAIIIDDEKQSHRSLKAMLNKSDKNIEVLSSAYSVQEGISLIEKQKPDVIFLDINMPDGLGFDVLKGVKNNIFASFLPPHTSIMPSLPSNLGHWIIS
jgi:two-component system, LytTR family, response regulator